MCIEKQIIMYLHINNYIWEWWETNKITCGPPLLGWCFFQTPLQKGHFFHAPLGSPESRPHLEQGASPSRRRAVNLGCGWWVGMVSHRHWAWHGWKTSGSHPPSWRKGIFWVLVLELGISFLHVMIESKTFPWWWFTIIERIKTQLHCYSRHL